MTITNEDLLLDALGNNSPTFVINKASIANTAAGQFFSLWRATGTPTQGAIPGAAAVCNSALTGAPAFTNPTAPVRTYLARIALSAGNTGQAVEFHDRLAHMGGLNGTLTTAQTVSVDVSVATNNMANRRGATNYSDVQWWLEWYTDTGATAVTATVTYTNAAGTTGRTTTVSVPATTRASRMLPIIGLNGEFIQSIQSVTLSASTLTAGSFGVTATRYLASTECETANKNRVMDWASLGLPRIHDDACIFMITLCNTTTTGAIYGQGKLAQG